MASFRRIVLAFFAIIAVCGAVAAQAAPMASPAAIDGPAFAMACHCDAGCDASTCADMGACAQACVSAAVFLAATDNRAAFVSPAPAASLSGLYRGTPGHDWPPPLHPPRV